MSQESTEQALRLVKVVKDLSAAHSLNEIMAVVRTAAREIAGADGATFVLKDGEFCFYADEDAISPLWKGQRFPLKSCISGWAMLNKQAVVIEDISVDPRIPYEAYRPTFVRSLAMTPIRLEDPIGAIGTYWADRHVPSEDQLRVLQALADTVSVAMENVELYRSLEKRIDQLANADKAKDEFLMAMSHELRTPMNAVVGWSEILLTDDMSETDRREALGVILRNAKKQVHIIDDLFDVTNIIHDRIALEPRAVEIGPLVQAAVDGVKPDCARKGIPLRFLDDAGSAEVWGDPRRLEQVFANLLSNAVKFSAEGQEIFVHLSRQGPAVRLRVSDQGAGIASDVLPEIFDRFRQGDSSMTRARGGLGLGLAIVRSLVEAHKGEVVAESGGVGRGAIFTVTFPLLDRAEAGLAAGRPREASAS